MFFVDEVVLRLRAGRGGGGCVSFHREKFVPKGGPDGGDGGTGGSIFLIGDRNLSTLSDLSLHPTFVAPHGENGGPKQCAGKAGKDMQIRVPLGTEIFDVPESASLEKSRGEPASAGRFVVDIVAHGQTVCAARGGRGGGGNVRFSSARHRLPRFALRGAPGENVNIRLSLKLLSDLAIVGLPNSGKSTLLSALTAARPKIAAYPFTTLTPNLGVIRGETAAIILADIPGLVKDAHAGRGLGNRFLKHIERSRALLIVLDADPSRAGSTRGRAAAIGRILLADYQLLRDEICHFNKAIWERARLVAVNKLDLYPKAPVKIWSKTIGENLIAVSAKKGTGVPPLSKKIDNLWSALPAAERTQPETMLLESGAAFVSAESDGGFRIVSREWEELAAMLPADNTEARQWFVEKLRSDGVFRMLAMEKCAPGTPVRVGLLQIEYLSA